MSDLVFSLQELLKIVPGLAIFPLSFYLAWKKLGISVSASYAVRHELTLEDRLSPILLTNHKDRPLAIFAIHAVIDREISYQVEKFEPPLILKALESISIDPRPYSDLSFGAESYKPQFRAPHLVELYLVLSSSVIRCKQGRPPTLGELTHLSGYRIASKQTNTFNSLVYNNEAAYAITYKMNAMIKTAIIDRSGFICRGWNYRINMIPPEAMRDRSTVRAYLEVAQFDKASEWFAVDDLRRTEQSVPEEAL